MNNQAYPQIAMIDNNENMILIQMGKIYKVPATKYTLLINPLEDRCHMFHYV